MASMGLPLGSLTPQSSSKTQFINLVLLDGSLTSPTPPVGYSSLLSTAFLTLHGHLSPLGEHFKSLRFLQTRFALTTQASETSREPGALSQCMLNDYYKSMSKTWKVPLSFKEKMAFTSVRPCHKNRRFLLGARCYKWGQWVIVNWL